MAHFPASLSVSRQAGSSDTQKVCMMTKSRNRTGGMRWSKSRARHQPAHAVAAVGADSKDPEVHSAVKADESLTKRAIPKVEVLYVVMGCSETSVLSTRRRRGAKPLAVAAAAGLRMVQLASAVLWPASLFPQRAPSITACMFSMEVEQQTRSHRTVPSQGRLLQPSHHRHRSQTSVRHIFSEHLDVVCAQQRPSFVVSMSTASDISSIGTSYQIAKSRFYLLRPCKQTQPQAQTARTQRGPHRREGSAAEPQQ